MIAATAVTLKLIHLPALQPALQQLLLMHLIALMTLLISLRMKQPFMILMRKKGLPFQSLLKSQEPVLIQLAQVV